jgi:hypothetical protein
MNILRVSEKTVRETYLSLVRELIRSNSMLLRALDVEAESVEESNPRECIVRGMALGLFIVHELGIKVIDPCSPGEHA